MPRYIHAEFDAIHDDTRNMLPGAGPLLVDADDGRLVLQFDLSDKPDNTITIIVDPKDLLHAVADVMFEGNS